MTAHEDLRVVFVERALVVTHRGHVLDDDTVIRVLAFLVEDGIGGDHVIDDVRLGDFLGAELFLRAKIHAVVVTKVVVACDGRDPNTSVDEELDKSGLHLGLAGLEVITANEGIVLLCQLNRTRNERVLRGAIDEGSVLLNASHSEDCGWRDFFVTFLDSLEQVVGSVVDTKDDVGVALRISSPLDDDLVKSVGRLEVTRVPLVL